jgi:uncharacterized protein YdaT
LGKETFPFAMPVSEDQKHGSGTLIGDPGQILGEVYTIRSEAIIDLDEYMLNQVYYERKKVPILIPYKTDNADEFSYHEVEAFMWVGRTEFWGDQLASSDGKKLFAQSHRLFNAKENKDEPLGAYYLFDYEIEASRE